MIISDELFLKTMKDLLQGVVLYHHRKEWKKVKAYCKFLGIIHYKNLS
jgi:hypothetical protein